MEVMAKDGGSQSGKPWPRLTALYSDARGENSCQTVGLSRPLSRDATWKEKAAAAEEEGDGEGDIIVCLRDDDVVNTLLK
mmetsp:Transcript_3789/g.7249  ORF Transcript_3789/g.7249 Transcript_3789/m.7249 type:complete len:80 (+) Transcript_3789:1370-1609(+)